MPKDISILTSLNKSLTWNKARVKCFTLLVLSFVRNRTVNLTFAATSMTNNTRKDSEYRKAQRFFEKFDMPLLDIASFILSMLAMPKGGWKLSMDRTNWKFGETHINLLVIGIVVKEIAVPIVWMTLPQKNKRGNSNTNQRIELMSKLLNVLPSQRIDVLTMDREFTGARWLKWLDKQGVGFIVRIKKSHKLNGISAQEYRKLPNRKRAQKVTIWGMELYYASKPIPRGRDPYLHVVSNKYETNQALRIYKKRWSIELLFSHLKKRGFNLEDTHMSDPRKIERLFGVVTMSFFITYSVGEILATTTNLTVREKRKSIFRLGLETIMELLSNGKQSALRSFLTIEDKARSTLSANTRNIQLSNQLIS